MDVSAWFTKYVSRIVFYSRLDQFASCAHQYFEKIKISQSQNWQNNEFLQTKQNFLIYSFKFI